MLPVTAELIRANCKSPTLSRLDIDVLPRFKPGDRIVARNFNPPGHTRLPRYARGRQGRIERDHGVFCFPDNLAHGRDDKPQHLYTVRFTAQELWGSAAPARDGLYLNMWDDYMDPA